MPPASHPSSPPVPPFEAAYHAEVLGKEALSETVWCLRLHLPTPADPTQPDWHFSAGQYAHVASPAHPSLPARPYSIASPPYDVDGKACTEIHLHVRDTGHGLSHALAADITTGDTLHLSAPAGRGLPLPSANRKTLFLAGGVGIAPVCSLLGAAKGLPAPALYWGVDDVSDLYLDRLWKTMVSAGTLSAYTPLLRARDGLIGDALLRDYSQLAGYSIYLAGPPAMIEATLPVLLQLGAEKAYIFGDEITL